MLFVCHPKTLQKPWLRFLLGVKMVRRETENNAYAKFWGDKDHHGMFMVFSGVVNCALNIRNSLQWFSWLTSKKIASQSVIPKATFIESAVYNCCTHCKRTLFLFLGLFATVPGIFSRFTKPGWYGHPFSYRLSDLGWG